jgi:hypothetical protein
MSQNDLVDDFCNISTGHIEPLLYIAKHSFILPKKEYGKK